MMLYHSDTPVFGPDRPGREVTVAKGMSTPTRISADVAKTATAVSASEHRSFSEQVNYWARIGMQIERSQSLAFRRVIAVAAGEAQFSDLDPSERVAAHALIDARINERAANEHFGASARSAGRGTVSIDDDGNLVEIEPGGTRRKL